MRGQPREQAGGHPREFVMVERRRLRERAERTIEALIDILDQLDGDPDLEDGGDEEPSLGWESGRPARFAGGCTPGSLDCESDAGDEPESDPADYGIGDADGLLEQWGGTWNGALVL